MSEQQMPSKVHIVKHNEGYSVVYETLQRALRSSFTSEAAAVEGISTWNASGSFQMELIPGVLDHTYDVNEERAKLGLKPLEEDRDGRYYIEHILALKELVRPEGRKAKSAFPFDVDAEDAVAIRDIANNALKIVGDSDPFVGVLREISEFSNGRAAFEAEDAQDMIILCEEAIYQVDQKASIATR
jgi:hypothetical protein